MVEKPCIYLYPHKVLKTKCKNVSFPLDKKSRQAISMMETLFSTIELNSGQPRGYGFAANQGGFLRRIIAINFKAEGLRPYWQSQMDAPRLLFMINPVIEATSKEMVAGEEGCMSVLSHRIEKVWRHEWIEVSYFDRSGGQHLIQAEGWLARTIQHEVDHLNGIMFFERMDADDFFAFQLNELDTLEKNEGKMLPGVDYIRSPVRQPSSSQALTAKG